MVALFKANIMNKEKEEHLSELSNKNQASQNDYDNLNMHHHPGNAKQEENQSLPEKLSDAHKTNSIKPGETLNKKVIDVNYGNGEDVC